MKTALKFAVWACLSAGFFAAPASALEIELPVGSRLTAERLSVLDSFDAPVAVFDGEVVPHLIVEGAIERRAWRINSPGLTPLQVILPLREQLVRQGYDLVFECSARECGGFDFRFDVEVLPGPNMYVNIAEYRYLTAVRGTVDAPEAAVGVLVSVTRGTAYVQIISAASARVADVVLPELAVPPKADDTESSPVAVNALRQQLLNTGHTVLAELDFAIGTTNLGGGPFASLAALAAFMEEEPSVRVLLVGHTDTIGDLRSNTALSKARATSVRDRLIGQYGVDPARLEAEGTAYLAPVASNLTEEGRGQNRRVEAVLLPTQ